MGGCCELSYPPWVPWGWGGGISPTPSPPSTILGQEMGGGGTAAVSQDCWIGILRHQKEVGGRRSSWCRVTPLLHNTTFHTSQIGGAGGGEGEEVPDLPGTVLARQRYQVMVLVFVYRLWYPVPVLHRIFLLLFLIMYCTITDSIRLQYGTLCELDY
jgi:hypothetical protein